MEKRKVIVIGGGPAAYTAGLYLARATLSPLVITGEAAGGQLMWTTEVENYPGFPDGVMGPELVDRMKRQAEKFGAEMLLKNVTKVDFSGKSKKVWVGDVEYETEVVIVAMGAQAKMLQIGEERLLGRGVSTCAVCDAAFFKNKKTFVVGGGDAAIEDALALRRFTSEVKLVHRRGELRASKIMQKRLEEAGVEVVWDSEVVNFAGEEKLEKITLKNIKTGVETVELADGLFLAIGHSPVTELLKGQVELDNHGYLITKLTSNQSGVNQEIWLNGYPTLTSATGVFGAGDIVDLRYRQAITAAAMGCQAALDAEKYLTGTIGGW